MHFTKDGFTKDSLKKILVCLADFLNEHWIWKTIILFIPSIYMPVIVKYSGEKLYLSFDNGELTLIGCIVTVIVYFIVLCVNILSSYKAKRDKEKDSEKEASHKEEIDKYIDDIQGYANTLNVYGKLMNAIGNICELKLTTIGNYINSSLLDGVFHKPFNETVNPQRQLREIAKEIRTCLSEITAPPFDNISVSMAYEFPTINKATWWIDQQEIAQCMTLGKLKKNPNTTFYKVYSGKSDFLFFNDKAKAAKENNYVFDNKDHRYHDIGSIICDEISIIQEDEKIARLILSISTYGYKFTDKEEKDVIDNMSYMIEEVLLQQFEKRIRIELALLYIKDQYNKS